MYKDLLKPVPNDNHQAIVVPSHIKNRIGWHIIGRIEKLSNMVKVPEFGVLHG
jgi:hypothetical protein